ncbi:MAG: aminotransferase class I/II-fold pyridoxal phosphate-dependent enzyme [Desulfobacterales bacterium]|nr:aminotransferase class I/II-fold pyridoxal phosphate-dependent enzyme [Desulfobacterales bacterium]MBF0395444.1 aminotransferase class I/II-fold pyridoxal phosphate-dependent enzyme [Desulfobacterales bacterium]
MIKVKPNISDMLQYSPPWAHIDRTKYLRLDLNENTLNPPKHVLDSLKNYIDENKIQMYPEYSSFLLKLSKYVGVGTDHLILTNGSDQGIEIILRAFLGYNDKMVIAQPCFPIFEQVARVINANICGIPYNSNLIFPYNEFVNAIDKDTKLIVIINPDNPTGASVSLSQIKKILDDNPDKPVLVDEAYFEYTGVTALDYLKSNENLIITRTFSKAFAMAGLRLGYAICKPDVMKEFYKIRGPFDVNSCAIVAAEAQLDNDKAWKEYIREIMTVSKPYLERFFDENKVKYYMGSAHFMIVKPKNRDKAVSFLKDNGILVRPMVAKLIKDTFRMNVGTFEQTKKFTEVYKKYLEGGYEN